ncbi:unnamed protein product [Angiostrongylus costaricensis]|uniref:Tubulin-specific chaperone E n=1 Tax=Angiostrongylus costaricensis TaxID=334426 RepID=A0A0R3PM72_ANGCS|nr:unnamed protein product [Angiostrongylus costaricensis]
MAVIGERVMVGGHSAVIRYVGEVAGYPGIWAGVEWDDPNRGKHNGFVNGVQYFRTKYVGGSLVNIQNVHRGLDLLTAILNRYADSVDENVFVIHSKTVELVGMQSTSQKQSNVFELRYIVLESCSVVAPPVETCPSFSRCVSLNLFNNLLQQWEDIRKILMFFPRLRELVLRYSFELCFRKNRMETAGVGGAWSDVKCLSDLIISDCDLSAESVCLRTLHAVGNRFTHFFVPDVADSLQNLDIGNNPISCLSNINGNLNKLEKLSVVDCGIKRIVVENGRFPSLTTLNIKDNVISDVSDFFLRLFTFFDLTGISTHEVPFSAIERHSAEVRFLDKYICADDNVKAEHVIDIERLRMVHGTIAVVDSKGTGLNVVPLAICYEGNTIEKRLPLSMTVQKLTEMVCLRVTLQLDKGTHQILLENPLRTLDFYSPEPGDSLRLVAV